MKYPFEATLEEIQNDPEPFIDAVFASLESDFLILPKGRGFIEYATFENGYELLKRVTRNFTAFRPGVCIDLISLNTGAHPCP